MAYGLTRRQGDVLRFIAGFIEAHGYAPTQREIAAGIGSPQGAATQTRLEALSERGLIRRLPNRACAIEILEPVTILRLPDGHPLYIVPGFGDAG